MARIRVASNRSFRNGRFQSETSSVEKFSKFWHNSNRFDVRCSMSSKCLVKWCRRSRLWLLTQKSRVVSETISHIRRRCVRPNEDGWTSSKEPPNACTGTGSAEKSYRMAERGRRTTFCSGPTQEVRTGCVAITKQRDLFARWGNRSRLQFIVVRANVSTRDFSVILWHVTLSSMCVC